MVHRWHRRITKCAAPRIVLAASAAIIEPLSPYSACRLRRYHLPELLTVLLLPLLFHCRQELPLL